MGAQIPTESELCRRFGISSITVRRAMGEHEALGIIRRVQGKGTEIFRDPDDGKYGLYDDELYERCGTSYS